MPAIHSPKIVAFVEGEMERLFINGNFSYVRPVSIYNGDSWTIQQLAFQIGTKYSVMADDFEKIIVWIDKERHEETSEQIAAVIRAELISRGADVTRIAICVPSRMTENVILADEQMIREYFNRPEYSYQADTNGKRILKDLFKGIDVSYKETFHGVQLLKKTKLERSSNRLPEVRNFLNSLNIGSCWWLEVSQ